MSESLAAFIAKVIDDCVKGENDYPGALEMIASELSQIRESGYPVRATGYLQKAFDSSRAMDKDCGR